MNKCMVSESIACKPALQSASQPATDVGTTCINPPTSLHVLKMDDEDRDARTDSDSSSSDEDDDKLKDLITQTEATVTGINFALLISSCSITSNILTRAV